MDISVALDFAAANHRAVLGTRRRDGGPQLSPVVAGVIDGALVVSSRAGLAKVSNLRRDPAATLLIMTDAFFGPWVQVEGPATIRDQSDPRTLGLLEDVYRSIAGEHPDWADYRRAMIEEDRVVIEIRPERAAGVPPRG
ncbi:PPOX class F420-dependent oxidoreductase [Naumannella cuiyingiana]|uniref:PPOX class probable F420-dependent enzyme n=1 Tax=Naumannella cuiyingiana TaxID=1347891 RepID=A0A7Z0DBS3_9ACTN|nr:PPOX class F420-dependent oxidoreductase [Naumannella cuiyingiana]NYI72399.1 PPOX class probable F420-dependent enzyme [Naumannella cuiyingiana]